MLFGSQAIRTFGGWVPNHHTNADLEAKPAQQTTRENTTKSVPDHHKHVLVWVPNQHKNSGGLGTQLVVVEGQ